MVLFCPDWLQTFYGAEGGPNLLILLLLFPKCSHYRYTYHAQLWY
jgi:hypothetical protein